MAERILVDGDAATVIPTDDRGLAYGDGVFRTLRVTGGMPIAWSDHMERLVDDCRRLALSFPGEEWLAADARRLFTAADEGVLKVMITRGSGGRGYAPPTGQASRRIVSAHTLPIHGAGGLEALELEYSPVRLAIQPLLAGVKHLNRLEQVLARAKCQRQRQEDALMCDAAGRPLCTTMRNLLFCDSNGQWTTPALTRAGVVGVTRQRLMRALDLRGRRVTAVDMTREDMVDMRAVIACNSVGGVRPVSRIDRHAFAASEKTAEMCRNLLK